VSVTILFTEKIYFKDEKKEEGFFSSFFKSFKQNNESSINTQINNKFRKNTIMIIVHGGGFIASSTLFHERYLRKWEKCLNIPIFGINYSLAPEYPYPEALNDVYQAYIWILKHAKEELNMDIKHIILSGDSAGANIALGLYHLLIVMKDFEKQLGKDIILPELLLAQYPAVFIDLKNYSNSFLLSLDDPMLNFNGMKYMCEKYVGNYPSSEEDPFLNPIKINDFILDRIKAKIRICFGSRDVLREDGLRLLDIYNRYNNRDQNKNIIDARGFDILYMGHGFNGRDEKSQKISRDVIIPEIEEFLNNIN
jgi:hormone-sensitive lipase